MARAHFVKSARKPRKEHGIKKGDSYYWWAFMQGGRGGPKHYSLTPPKRSQLTQSEFWSTVFDIQDSNDAVPDFDDIESSVDGIKDELQNLLDETQSKLENMPEGLQQGGTGETLQQRIDSLESVISDLDSFDFSFQEPETEGDEEKDFSEEKEARAQEIWSEVTDYLNGIEG